MKRPLELGTASSQSLAVLKLCRFVSPSHPWPEVGLISTQENAASVYRLAPAGIQSITTLLEQPDFYKTLQGLVAGNWLPSYPVAEIRFLAPIERQEVWAAGVTYQRSKAARMEESDFSASAYDRVYDAPRPEIFFKSLPQKVVPSGEPVGIRSDAKWNVPEPELALVFNSRREIVGYTLGNDMSSRDIEGENLLYLPQAKTYSRSCSLAPFITIGASEEQVRSWTIHIEIRRGSASVFQGNTPISRIKRSFDELAKYLFQSQVFPDGAVLLTGTGIVPENEFTLAVGDVVKIWINEIGELSNVVKVV